MFTFLRKFLTKRAILDAPKRALIIAIGDYPEGVPRLAGPRNDAKSWRSVLEHHEYVVETLSDRQATKEWIFWHIQRLAQATKSLDRLVIVYSGHGSQVASQRELDGCDETWYTYDGHFLDDDLAKALSAADENGIVTVISDSCHSGNMSREITKVVATRSFTSFFHSGNKVIKKMGPHPKVPVREIYLSACRSDQVAYEGVFGWHAEGVLSHYLTGILARNITYSVEQVYAELRERLPSPTWPQEPVLECLPDRLGLTFV